VKSDTFVTWESLTHPTIGNKLLINSRVQQDIFTANLNFYLILHFTSLSLLFYFLANRPSKWNEQEEEMKLANKFFIEEVRTHKKLRDFQYLTDTNLLFLFSFFWLSCATADV
jgi:hypothetical protein